MLTKFFSKSKPIVLFFLIALSWIALGINLFLIKEINLSTISLLIAMGSLSFIIFLENFIIKKNKINQQNSFGLSLFVFGVISILPLVQSTNTWWIILFIGLFFRRLISMLNEASLKKKTFEASAWLILASFFEPSLILLLLLIWLANLILSVNQFANYLIPPITFGGAFILANAWSILKRNEWFSVEFYIKQIKLDLTWEFEFSFLYILLLTFICLLSFPGFVQRAQVLKKIQLNLLLISVLFVVALISFIQVSSPSLYILSLFPLAPIGGEFFQLKTKIWLKEILWWVLIGLSIFSYVIKLFFA